MAPRSARALYDALLSLNGADPGAGYATDWTVSPDGLTYVFDLHSDWKFSDGTPVTPEDYIFSCMRETQQQGGRVVAARQRRLDDQERRPTRSRSR